MVAARRLLLIALIRRLGRGIILEGTNHDQVEIERKGFAIPDEAIDTVAKQGRCQHIIAILAKLWCLPRTPPV